METIEIVGGILFIVGCIVILHYIAFAISWGFYKGKAKIPQVTNTTNNWNIPQEIINLLKK